MEALSTGPALWLRSPACIAWSPQRPLRVGAGRGNPRRAGEDSPGDSGLSGAGEGPHGPGGVRVSMHPHFRPGQCVRVRA